MQAELQKELGRFNEQVVKWYNWNYWVSITAGTFFSLGMGFVSQYTILPLFVLNITDSKTLVGLITAISMLGSYLPQIFIAKYVEGIKHKKRLTAFIYIFQRAPWFFMALFTYVFAGTSSTGLLVSFFLLYAVFAFACGLCTPSWFDLTAKTIPQELLGRYFGVRNFFGGIAELGGALLAGSLIKSTAFPYNFAALFGIVFVAAVISFTFFIQIKEPDYPLVKKDVKFREYFRSLLHILVHQRNFRAFVIALFFIQTVVMANALFTASAVERLGLGKNLGLQVGIFTALLMTSQMVSYLIWGNLSDRYGHRRIIAISAGVGIAASLAAAIGNHLYVYYLVFVLTGIATGASRISYLAIIPEFSSAEDRPTYVGLFNSITGIAVTLASFLGGVLTDLFSYQVTFSVTGLLVALGLWILLSKVRAN